MVKARGYGFLPITRLKSGVVLRGFGLTQKSATVHKENLHTEGTEDTENLGEIKFACLSSIKTPSALIRVYPRLINSVLKQTADKR
jgi:hypothetical protein